MRFEEIIHWSDGLHLQPHHLQRQMRNFYLMLRESRALCQTFPYGLIELEMDEEALKSRRIVVNKICAIMPDGLELCMPGNCELDPLTLTEDDYSEDLVTIYLAVPLWSSSYPNVNNSSTSLRGRFVLTEREIADENTSDNPIPIMMRRFNVSLITDPKAAPNCVTMPLCKVRWKAVNQGLASLTMERSYMPPFLNVSRDCPLLPLLSELLFQLKSCKNAISSELEGNGYDPRMLSGESIVTLMRLQSLNKAIYLLDNLLVPERCDPFTLYLELLSFLGELEIAEPTRRSEKLRPYDHDDALPCFDEILVRIRSIIMKAGVSTALSFEFADAGNPYLELAIDDLRVFSASDVFLAVEYDGDLRSRAQDIELGDNFRLTDVKSFSDRVRGVKLTEVRYPPSYLPSLSHTLWFKVMKEQSPRIWNYISEDHRMIIDRARDLFPNLKASLYVNIREEGAAS